MKQRGWRRRLKRAMDLTVAVPALVAAAPLMAGAAVAVAASMGRPILFRQPRAGKDGEVFEILKFRTMRQGAPDASPDDDHLRITRVGQFLRDTSIDELPQLVNVIRGDMSIVGPRPLLVRYLPRYSAEQRRRHEVLPGLTGWAQVHGRNAVSWEEKFAHDVWYVDHWSPWLDLRVLLKTVGKLADRRGISAEGHTTMPEFRPAGAHPGAPSPTVSA